MKHSQPLRLRSAHLQVCLACSLLTLSHCFPIGYFSQEHCFSESAVQKNSVCAPHSDSKLTTSMMVSPLFVDLHYYSLFFTFSVLLVALNLLTAGGVWLWSVFLLGQSIECTFTSLLKLQSRPFCLKKLPDTLMMPRGCKGCTTKTDTRAKSSRQVVLKLFRPLNKSYNPSTTKSQA